MRAQVEVVVAQLSRVLAARRALSTRLRTPRERHQPRQVAQRSHCLGSWQRHRHRHRHRWRQRQQQHWGLECCAWKKRWRKSGQPHRRGRHWHGGRLQSQQQQQQWRRRRRWLWLVVLWLASWSAFRAHGSARLQWGRQRLVHPSSVAVLLLSWASQWASVGVWRGRLLRRGRPALGQRGQGRWQARTGVEHEVRQ